MDRPLRILHLEDDPDYAQLVRDLLGKEGLEAEIVLVKSQAEFEAALDQTPFDVILADYLLPYYTGLRALALAREKVPQIPFLLVSGTIGEHAAIESLRSGATDYVLKQWPERLVPAVRRAIQEAEERNRRERAETELARREKYFRSLTENSLDILTILNQEGLFRYNSPSLKRLCGYEPEEVVGQIAFGFIHPEDLPEVLRVFELGLKNPGLILTIAFRFRRRDGSWIELEAVGQNCLADPDIAGIVVNSRDVSERKQAERALSSSEAMFRSVWENSVDGMILTDERGVVVAANEAFCSLVGIPARELEGKLFTDIYAASVEPGPVLARHRENFSRRVAERNVERRLALRNGTVVETEFTSSYVELQGRPRLQLSLFRDVTAHKKLEEQLRHSQKMEAIGQLAGGIAHDFNNILTVIHGHASLLVAGGDLPSTAARSAQQIVQASARAASLTRQLLTFSRRQVMEAHRLDMNEVVGNMTKMLGRILGETVVLAVQFWPEPALLLADVSMVEQVLLNLAVNARDAMPEGGNLEIRISIVDVGPDRAALHPEWQPGRFVRLSVVDTGSGIAPEHLRRVFEPFFTTKEAGKGTGLGLATVYGVVKQHQGWIEVQSELSQGTTFDVYFPASSDQPDTKTAQDTQITIPGGNERILVVEDEQPVREFVAGVLRQLGYQVWEAASGRKALEVWKAQQGAFDLLLTDLVMPEGINGRDLAERLRAESPQLKVVFTSGYSDDVVGEEFVRSHGLNYLQKPYHPQKLALVVRECLDAPAMDVGE